MTTAQERVVGITWSVQEFGGAQGITQMVGVVPQDAVMQSSQVLVHETFLSAGATTVEIRSLVAGFLYLVVTPIASLTAGAILTGNDFSSAPAWNTSGAPLGIFFDVNVADLTQGSLTMLLRYTSQSFQTPEY